MRGQLAPPQRATRSCLSLRVLMIARSCTDGSKATTTLDFQSLERVHVRRRWRLSALGEPAPSRKQKPPAPKRPDAKVALASDLGRFGMTPPRCRPAARKAGARPGARVLWLKRRVLPAAVSPEPEVITSYLLYPTTQRTVEADSVRCVAYYFVLTRRMTDTVVACTWL